MNKYELIELIIKNSELYSEVELQNMSLEQLLKAKQSLFLEIKEKSSPISVNNNRNT